MAIEQVELSRYRPLGSLGSGADYQVRSALDEETGREVALKRPQPQMVSKRLHGRIEARTDRTLQILQSLDFDIPTVVPVLGYTRRANHDHYFGDSLGQEYTVVVEERAKGIPLVGDPMARITKVPIGVGQNLFTSLPHGPARRTSRHFPSNSNCWTWRNASTMQGTCCWTCGRRTSSTSRRRGASPSSIVET